MNRLKTIEEREKDLIDIHKALIENGITESVVKARGNNRDTQGWAVKCSSITVDEGSPIDNGDGTTTWEPFYVDRNVYKDPITAPGKKSKRGKITTYYNPATNIYFTDKIGLDMDNSAYDVMKTVYKNGSIIKEYTLEEVRVNNA